MLTIGAVITIAVIATFLILAAIISFNLADKVANHKDGDKIAKQYMNRAWSIKHED